MGCSDAYELFAGTLLHLRDLMESETRKRLFVSIPQDMRDFYAQERIFGKAVYDAFPSGRIDATAAGNCLATGNGTACVFHLMRSVEWGLRALCSHFRLTRIKRTKKNGRVSFTPIDYAEWETMLNQLRPKIDARILKLKRGPEKQREQEYLYPLLEELQGFRDAWRNHVMHTRRNYDVGEATTVFTHVRRFLEALSIRVSEI